MNTAERKARFLFVIETRTGPGHFAVTVAAGGTKGAPVGIVIAVAVDTLRLRIEKAQAEVTIPAHQLQVLTEQRKLRKGVVEANGLSPGKVVVAVVTGRAELPFMGILVTSRTGRLERS